MKFKSAMWVDNFDKTLKFIGFPPFTIFTPRQNEEFMCTIKKLSRGCVVPTTTLVSIIISRTSYFYQITFYRTAYTYLSWSTTSVCQGFVSYGSHSLSLLQLDGFMIAMCSEDKCKRLLVEHFLTGFSFAINT